MPEIHAYRKLDVPRDIAMQIASAVRYTWPQFFKGTPPLWETTPYPDSCLHFVLVDGDVLISHAIVSARPLTHRGETFTVYGLSSVICFPTHRGQGFGERVVAGATDYIKQQPDADFALLFCGERVKPLYERTGWTHTPHITVTYGPDNKTYSDGYLMGLFVSDRARAHRFDEAPLYVGANTW